MESFRVFLASPSDVAADRESTAQAIDELNRLLQSRNIRFDLVRWETDSVPAVATDYSQQAINKQLLGDIDIMIAIFGTRLGSPTPSAPSATAEEVRMMLNKVDHPLRENRLMVYFKRVKVDALDCDLDQLRALREFRTELQSAAVYYKEYESSDELKESIRQALTRFSDSQKSIVRESMLPRTTESHPEREDFGLLDHKEIYESGMEQVQKHLNEGNRIISELAKETTFNSEQLNAHAAIGSTALAVDTINKQADLMDRCAVALTAEFGLAKQSMAKALGHALELVNLQLEDFGADKQATSQNWTGVISDLEQVIESTRDHFSGFRQSIERLPRINRRLNSARRNLLAALDQFDSLLDQTVSSATAIKTRIAASVH